VDRKNTSRTHSPDCMVNMEGDLHGLNFIEFHQRCRPYRDDNASKDGTGWVRNFREMRFLPIC